MELSVKIAELRKNRDMTQVELAARLNVTFQAVSKWERAESVPDFATLARMAKVLNVPLDFFCVDYDENSVLKPEVPCEKIVSKPIGVCSECGMVVDADDVGCRFPRLICKKCMHELFERIYFFYMQ